MVTCIRGSFSEVVHVSEVSCVSEVACVSEVICVSEMLGSLLEAYLIDSSRLLNRFWSIS